MPQTRLAAALAPRQLVVAGHGGRFYHAAARAGAARRATKNRKTMLQSLRKSAGSFIIKVLFLLLVLSFAVWGIGDTFFRGRGGNTVADVGGTDISVRALDTAFRSEVDRLRRFNIDEQQARQLGVLDQVLERLIAVTLVDKAADSMGIVVGKAVVQEQIRNQLGQSITPEELQARLRNAGLTEAEFIAQLRRQIVNAEYQGSLASGIKAPKALVDRLYHWRGEKRTAKVMTLPVDPASKVADPTPEQLETYYKAHPGDYTAPEYRAISYLYLDPKAIAKKMTVSDEKLRELYKQRAAQYIIPEKRTVLQMLVPDRATADKAVERLNKGEAFVAVAKDIAGQDETATRLGSVTKSDLPKEISEAVFTLAKDKVSDPVQGPFGVQILKVTDIQPGRTQSFDEVRGDLAKEAAQEAAIDSVLATTNRIEETLGGGADLATTARELGLELHKVATIDHEGQDREEKAVPDLPPAPFLQIAFETASGQDSLLNETDDNGYFVLHVDSITPPALKPLDIVRDEATDDWKSEVRWNAAREQAQKIVERLNAGMQLGEIAKELKLETADSKGFTRAGEGASVNMPNSLIADLFAAKTVGHAASADGVGGIAIAQLTGINMAKPEDDKAAVDQLGQSLDGAIANDVASQLVTALRERYGVTVNQPAIKANFFRDANGS
jgi:peptidyl-prolyl cis-trans isomerase D